MAKITSEKSDMTQKSDAIWKSDAIQKSDSVLSHQQTVIEINGDSDKESSDSSPEVIETPAESSEAKLSTCIKIYLDDFN